MQEPLVVVLNRGELHEVAPASDSFETTGSFDVRFRNEGRAVHVHLKLDGPLSHVASLGEPNRFVDTDGAETVRVAVEDGAGPIEGWLEVATGYGSASERVGVTLRDPAAESGVAVDESLGEPAPVDDGGDREGLVEALTRQGSLRVGGFAALAVLLSAVAVVLAPSPSVGLGVVAVLVGVAVALYLLLT